MAFRVRFTGNENWPIEYDEDFVPMKARAKGFRIDKCDCTTHKVKITGVVAAEQTDVWQIPRTRYKNTYAEYEATDGFWVDAVSAITDANGIVTFS